MKSPKKKNKKRRGAKSGIAVAMRKRFPRSQTMRHRANRRANDAKNHWSKDTE